MRFDELIAGFPGERTNPSLDPEVRRVAVDSRQVEPGDCFVALRRGHTDAHRFAAAALEAGAVALVLERGAEMPAGLLERDDAAIFLVDDSETLLAELANRINGDPTRHLSVVAVTGTNGKTTTTLLVESIFRAAGKPCGVIGTLFFRLDRWEIHGRHTTPQAHELFWLLCEMRQRGAKAVAMEASSHGLELNRLYGALVDAAVFTNLSHDHLDFHGDMESYFAAKRKLFMEYLPAARAEGKPGIAIVNVDDPWGQRLLREIPADVPVLRYGLDGEADIRAEDLASSGAGSRFALRLPGGRRVDVALPLVARHNVLNALGAAGAAWACGVSAESIAMGLSNVGAVPGRLERVARKDGRGPTVFVDYSHTPDALERALDTLRALQPTELRVVFGCGGDRDKTKRRVMGRIAAERADLVVVTNDNPRSEDPQAILEAIREGIRETGLAEANEGRGWLALADRRAAIGRAIQNAPTGSIVLLAGKGHETYQEVMGKRHPFDDRLVAQEVLESWSGDPQIPIFRTWTAARLAAAVGGELTGEPLARAEAIRNDSRLAQPGDLFVALRAERDGHDFISSAREQGARILLVEQGRAPEPLEGEAVIAVPDTVQALAALGRALWAAHAEARPDRVTIGLTGSNGKTTTKELVGRLLESAASPEQVLVTAGNLNNHIGLPITLARLAAAHRFVVLEMGASVPGDIAHLVRIAPVQRALVTSIAAAHLEGLGSEDAVAVEKGSIFGGLTGPGLAVVPWGWRDQLVPASFAGRVATFGHVPNASVTLVSYQPGPPAQVELNIGPPLCSPPETVLLELALLGRHNALNLAAAAALVWDLLPDPAATLVRVAGEARAVPGRLTIRRARAGARLLDDAYNANPGSMAAALVVLSEFPGRRWLIAGDMLELGDASARAHRELGQQAASHGVERVWAVGQLAEHVVAGATAAGVSDVATFADADACSAAAREALEAEHVVLVKGSRGVRLERVVAALLEEAG